MKTNKLIALGLLVATNIILARFLSFYIPLFGTNAIRAGLGHIPIIMAGFLFGPIAGAMVGVAGDVLGTLLFSPFPYFPGFTVSAATIGILSGLLIKLIDKKPFGFIKMLGLVYAVEIPTSVFMNTKFVSMISGVEYTYLLWPRVIGTSILVIGYSVILFVLYNQLIKLDFIVQMRDHPTHKEEIVKTEIS